MATPESQTSQLDSLSDQKALDLACITDTNSLVESAGKLRDAGHGQIITYSRKVFIPLTHLCRDVCHYCTFARTPRHIEQAFMSREQVFELCEHAISHGCQEALFTLGEKPELRYKAAREALQNFGFASTLDYVADIARHVHQEFGILPHINAGNMTTAEIQQLRRVSASMGIMLESASDRLCEKGMPHYGSPDKVPATRLHTIALAGEAAVPFTSGILIGIGETRLERIEALLALRQLHQQHGHLQEIIVQNFRAKPNTKMAQSPEPDLDDLLWTIAVARLIFGPHMNIQAPPNLSPGVLPKLIAAGINDWGGVSPVSPDHVNPEAPWPHLEHLARETATAGKYLEQRLTIYPEFVKAPGQWLATEMQTTVMQNSDAEGFARRDKWAPGQNLPVPVEESQQVVRQSEWHHISEGLRQIVKRCEDSKALSTADIVRMFSARGPEFSYLCSAANTLRKNCNGDSVSYVVNRNINYTNVCYFKCQFCAFSKGKLSENLRGKPYDISASEIARRCTEAWERGATEVCLQGGIHPDYTGQTYIDIVATIKATVPDLHIHAFSPLEVWQGAETLGLSLKDFLLELKRAGLNTLPGTAAEILHDEVRQKLCPDKLNTAQWLQVMETAHEVGFSTTATIMFGHVDRTHHWASHLLAIRNLQQRTRGFTEFVPLPYVHMEAPMYLKGNSRKGPSYREAILMHAIPRLVFNGYIQNIQASWVKMGKQGVADCLNAGANDLGGTLMNESITRAAGAEFGQEWEPADIEKMLKSMNRPPRMRTTLYGDAPQLRRQVSLEASKLLTIENQKASKTQSSKRLETSI